MKEKCECAETDSNRLLETMQVSLTTHFYSPLKIITTTTTTTNIINNNNNSEVLLGACIHMPDAPN